MQFAPYPNYPQLQVSVDDVASALALVRRAIKEGPAVPWNDDPAQFLVAIRAQAPGAAQAQLELALDQVLATGTEIERSWGLGVLVISDNDWRLKAVKTLVERAPAWLAKPNPRDGHGRPLGRLVVRAALGRVVHLHPGLSADLERHADSWGAGDIFLCWAVKQDPDGDGLRRVEAYSGDLSDSAGLLGITYGGRDEANVQRVAKKLTSASASAKQDFLWQIADYESDKAVVARVAATLGLPAL